jgi:hypothetical protein
MKRIAILQPNYIPWKGVFDLISKVDVFVFYDDVQYTKRDWRNRNIIKTPQGPQYLSVPVLYKSGELVKDVPIDPTSNWQNKHYKTIVANYSKAPYFEKYEGLLNSIFLQHDWHNIAELDIFATKRIAQAFGLRTEWIRSSDLGLSGDKNGEKIIKICKKLDCNFFINGPAAHSFMNQDLFISSDIKLRYIKYNFPKYAQLFGDFTHFVSALDVLFNCGPKSKNFISTSTIVTHEELAK